jgi:dTDP-glucose 4,6-dehydratase
MPASPLQGRAALVLGASGFIGRWVARELAARGARTVGAVRAAGRFPRELAAGVELVATDLARPGNAAELLERLRPDVVLDLAGYGVAKEERDEALAERLNHGLVVECLSALERPAGREARLVLAGTALEAGPGPASLDELAPCAPATLYGTTKLAATRAAAQARARGLAVVVARPFTVFGPGERPGRLVPTLLAARGGSGRIPLSSGSQRRDWVYVEDVARALVDLAELPADSLRSGRYPFDAPCLNLASGALTSVRDFVLALAEEFGIARERLGFGDLPPLPEEMHHPPPPVGRLRAALGWTPSPDPRDGLRRLAARVREGLA